MVVGILVYPPDVPQLFPSHDIFSREQGRHHGMVLVVVFVHAISTDEVESRHVIFQPALE
jgi:hypothetical protein